MIELRTKTASETSWDLVSLGEILIRFDPGELRIRDARQFRVWDGGAEYNVAKNISRVFGLRTAVASSCVDNQIGRMAADLAREGGVDTSLIEWRDADESEPRNGLYFIERGFGVRAPSSCFDRSHTAAAALSTSAFDWREIFESKGCRWFHTGGIFAGLSESTFSVAEQAMKAARESGSIVSYDLNYRDSLWKNRGGIEKANYLNRRLLNHADVVFGIPGFRQGYDDLELDGFTAAAKALREEFPNIRMVANLARTARSASRHDLAAVCAWDGGYQRSRDYTGVEVLDRVGSGDAFASGLIYGLLESTGIEYALECGAAHACLVMTTPGDNSTSTLEEIERSMDGGAAALDR